MKEKPVFPFLNIQKLIKLYQSKETLLLTRNENYMKHVVSELMLHTNSHNSPLKMELLGIFNLREWILKLANDSDFLSLNLNIPSNRLNSFGSELVWRIVIEEIGDKDAHLNVKRLAKLAMQADYIMQDWDISSYKNTSICKDDTFPIWKKLYIEKLIVADSEDFNGSYNRILFHLKQKRSSFNLPRCIVLYGFFDYSLRFMFLLRMLSSHGISIFILNILRSTKTEKKLDRFEFTDRYAEWRTASCWAFENLAKNKQSKYAIVSTDLKRDSFLGQRVLNQFFSELPKTKSYFFQPYILSKSIRSLNPIRAALLWLLALAKSSIHGSCETEIYGKAILLGYCFGDISSAAEYSKIDLSLRYKKVTKISVLEWLNLLGEKSKLGSGWIYAQSLWKKTRNQTSPYEWALIMEKSLEALGFPGEKEFDYVSRNIIRKVKELFFNLASLNPVIGHLSAIGAVKLLEEIADSSFFSSESRLSNRLALLDISEIEGQYWDGIWVLGLDNKSFPMKEQPNQFIPNSELGKIFIYGITKQYSLFYANRILDFLTQNIPEVVLSSPLIENGYNLQPSHILSKYFLSNNMSLWVPKKVNTHLTQEVVKEEIGPKLLKFEFARIKNHALDILDIQSKNPLWAFARYRLGVRALPSYSEKIISDTRGKFLHKILELIWKSVKDHQSLCKLLWNCSFDNFLEKCINEAASLELKDYSSVLYELECDRAKKILLDWFKLESFRLPFKVDKIEKTFKWKSNSLEFNIRIDRIDTLGNDFFIITDYKTGSMKSNLKSDWSGSRLTNIQLPLYAVVLYKNGMLKSDSYALVLARLHPKFNRLEGFSTNEVNTTGIKLFQKIEIFKDLDGNGIMDYWINSINRLSDEFENGVITNFFTYKSHMSYCDALPFLRIR